jgi:hypothetical protein
MTKHGEEKSVRIVQSTYDHFTIHKSVDTIDRRATEFHSLCFLLVFCDGYHIGGVTRRKWIVAKNPLLDGSRIPHRTLAYD